MFISLSYVGSKYGKITITKWLLGIIFPLIAITLWGYFAAPKSEYRLDLNSRIIFELLMFLVTAILLYKTQFKTVAITFAIVVLVVVISSYFFEK